MNLEQELIEILRPVTRPIRVPYITQQSSTCHESRVRALLWSMADRGIVRIIETHSAGTAGYMLNE